MSQVQILPAGRPSARLILTAEEMRQVDRNAISVLGIPTASLMESAGRAVAECVLRVVGSQRSPVPRIGLVCGRGNNGGDGFVAARLLSDWGLDVEVILCAGSATLGPDAALQLSICRAMSIIVRVVDDPMGFSDLPAPSTYAVIVDALLGTGSSGAPRGAIAEAIAYMNGHRCPIVSVDLPSGVDGNTGAVPGDAVWAQSTVALGASKVGHWNYPGAARRGQLIVADIGLPMAAFDDDTPRRRLLSPEAWQGALSPRSRDGHKGTFGHVYVLAGSSGKTGAARLACEAALRAGAGLVTLGTTREAFASVSGLLYEVMSESVLHPGEAAVSAAERLVVRIEHCSACVLGPGLPTDHELSEILGLAVPRISVPMVIDAEALNALARRPAAFESSTPKVLTPHPGEAARLLGCSTAEVQADRFKAARILADNLGAVVVLKGAYSLIADPDGQMALCAEGNPGMGTAGMGDVLAGMIGALLARGLPPFEAATTGVAWHARAGDRAAAELGETAMIASDILTRLGPK